MRHVVASVLMVSVLAGCGRSMSREDRVLVIAHRGDSLVAPENTLAAFRSAVAVNADLIELDARPTADGTLYCLHDDTVDRTTDGRAVLGGQKIKISELRDEQVTALDAGSWFAPQFKGEPMPTLAAALDVIQNGSRTLLERKSGSAEAYAKLLREKKLVGRLVAQAFDWKFLEQLHSLEPSLELGALGDKPMTPQRWADFERTGSCILAWKHTDLNPELMAECRARKLQVFAWTADKPTDWERLVGLGVDGIITNDPAGLRSFLAQRPCATVSAQ